MICPDLRTLLEEFILKKQEVSAAALFRPVARKIRIRCSNQPRWKGIELSDHPYAIHRLGKEHFAGLACAKVLEGIFPSGSDVIRVELTPDGALIQGEGESKISAIDQKKKNRGEPFLAPYTHRTTASFGAFTLRIETA